MAKHLTKEDIERLLVAHAQGANPTQLSRLFGVHRSTIVYHTTRSYIIARATPKTPAQQACPHSSCKCFVCGMMIDTIMRNDRLRILELEREVRILRTGR